LKHIYATAASHALNKLIHYQAVVFKPSGVHSLGWTNTLKKRELTLTEALPVLLEPPPVLRRGGSVARPPTPLHRLDARVAGLMVVAKTAAGNTGMNQLFSDRLVTKVTLP